MTTRRRRLRAVAEGYEPMRYWYLLQRALGRGLANEILRMARSA